MDNKSKLCISIVGSRRTCAKAIRLVSEADDYGFIDSVRITYISFTTYHLQFELESKVKI